MKSICTILDIECDLREVEGYLAMGIGRRMNCIKNEGWLDVMEDLGFFVKR